MKDWLNRLVPLIVAGIILAYLIYALFFKEAELSYLHIIGFALAAALVVIPLVVKVKITNVIELQTKFDEFKEHTNKELTAIKNIFTNKTDVQVNPILNFTLSPDGYNKLTRVIEPSPKSIELTSDKDSRSLYISRIESAIKMVRIAFISVRAIQIAYEEKRVINFEQDLGPEDPYEQGEFLTKHMTQSILKLIIPEIRLPEVINGVEAYCKLLQIYETMKNDKAKQPPKEVDSNEILVSVNNLIANLNSGIGMHTARLIEFKQKIHELFDLPQAGKMQPSE